MKTKIFLAIALMATTIAVAFAQNGKEDVAKLPNEVKGLALKDPVAISNKGQRDYYNDEEASIESLANAAQAGDSQAALFCGSACFNQGRYVEAVKSPCPSETFHRHCHRCATRHQGVNGPRLHQANIRSYVRV